MKCDVKRCKKMAKYFFRLAGDYDAQVEKYCWKHGIIYIVLFRVMAGCFSLERRWLKPEEEKMDLRLEKVGRQEAILMKIID